MTTFTALAADISIFPQTKRNSKRHYGNAIRAIHRHIELAVRDQEMEYWFWEAVQGVGFGRQTCRVSGKVEMTIRDMTPYAYLKLLCDIAAREMVQGDVPRYLNERYG
jgi:hypothetical protein